MPGEKFTTKIDNIRQDSPEWVTQKIKEELSSLNKEIEMFYEIKGEGENQTVECKMDIVKSYLESIKDLEWSDLKNKGSAWIMAVQIALESKGYDVGKIDGILGPNTKTAVKEFQNKNSLEEDGLPGKITISKILEKRDLTQGSPSNTNNGSNTQSKNETEGNHLNENAEKEPKDTDIVSVSKYIPTIKLEMRYATTNNFTGQKIYENSDATLRYGTIKKLKKAQDELNKQGYSIKIWDAYRPQSAQERLRSVRPDPTLVAKPEMLTYKLDFYEKMRQYVQGIRDNREEVIICGDFNICHTEIDIARPKENENSIGFLPIERAEMDKLEDDGLIDVFRKLNPDLRNQYTWWSYRGGARERNVGRRLDYFRISPDMFGYIEKMEHQINVIGSDHCPIGLDLN